MRRVLVTALVLLLAGFGAGGGYFGAAVYVGARGSLDGMNHACLTLQTAESKQVITQQQRTAIVDAMMDSIKKAGEDIVHDGVLVGYLKGDCSRSLWDTMTKT